MALIWYKSYKWPEPKSGDVFLYEFWKNPLKDEDTGLLIMKPTTKPITQHPLGFWGLVFLLIFIITIELVKDVGIIFFILFLSCLLSGHIFGYISYWKNYYLKEKKWKKQVIKDWKNGKLSNVNNHFTYQEGLIGKINNDSIARVTGKSFKIFKESEFN